MLTLARIATDKGPRTIALRDLDPSAFAAIGDRAAAMFTLDHDRWSRYDRRYKRMVTP